MENFLNNNQLFVDYVTEIEDTSFNPPANIVNYSFVNTRLEAVKAERVMTKELSSNLCEEYEEMQALYDQFNSFPENEVTGILSTAKNFTVSFVEDFKTHTLFFYYSSDVN